MQSNVNSMFHVLEMEQTEFESAIHSEQRATEFHHIWNLWRERERYYKFLSNSNYKVLPQPQVIKCQHEDKWKNITA